MNPLTVEQQFQLLQQTLPLLAGRRSKLLRLLEFIEPLLTPLDRNALRAYGPEIVGTFLRELRLLNLEATPYAFSRRLRTALDILSTHLSFAADEDLWLASKAALVSEDARVHAIVARKEDGADLSTVHTDPRLTGMADPMHPARGIAIPVVERELLLRKTPAVFAAVRRVRVEMHYSRHAAGEDEILVDQAFDADGSQHRQVRRALDMARAMAAEFAGVREEQRLIVHCTYDEPNTITGESLGTALTLAVFIELLRLLRYREVVAIRPDVAVTGVIDAGGAVRAVDEEGLRLKVEGCAYSAIRCLVVPREQEELARRSWEELGEEGAGPPLTIIGISTLNDILYDRRLTVLQKIPFAVYVLERTWGSWRPILLAVLLVLVAIAVRVWYGPFDRNPVRLEFSNDALLVENRLGEKLAQIPVGRSVAEMNKHAIDAQRSSRLVALADVNGDGEAEVIAVRERREELGTSNEICCWKVATADTLWSHRIQRRLTFPGFPETPDARFLVTGLVVDDFTGRGVPEIALIANHSSRYPSVLALLRASDGTEISSYLHTGALSDIQIARLDSGAVHYLIVCGISNPFRSACVVVFDPRAVTGMSPTDGDYVPSEYVSGSEKYYLLLPRTSVGEAFREQAYGNNALRLGVNGQGKVVVSVEDFQGLVPELGQRVTGLLTCTLGAGLELETLERGEIFNFTAEILARKGRIQPLPETMFLENYLKNLRYWDGSGWTNRPVVSQAYLQAIAGHSDR